MNNNNTVSRSQDSVDLFANRISPSQLKIFWNRGEILPASFSSLSWGMQILETIPGFLKRFWDNRILKACQSNFPIQFIPSIIKAELLWISLMYPLYPAFKNLLCNVPASLRNSHAPFSLFPELVRDSIIFLEISWNKVPCFLPPWTSLGIIHPFIRDIREILRLIFSPSGQAPLLHFSELCLSF